MEQLNSNKKWLSFIELFSAILLTSILFPIGFIFALFIQPFYNGTKHLFKYFVQFFEGIWFVITHIIHAIAFSLDVLGNVIVGELIEKTITKEQNTWFGMKEHSISQSIGYLEYNDKLNNFGKKLAKLLSLIFGKNHSINAYESYINKNNI